MRYIDVSEWQGNIDWERAKPFIDGVIIRAGYGVNHIDAQFQRNAAECNRLGIPCGAYWFSYARNPEMAKQEAEYLLAAVKPYKMHLPLCFDFEYDSVAVAAREGGVTVTRELATDLARTFCETVEAAGYYALFYANPDYLERYFAADLPRRFGLWLAQWPGGAPDVTRPPRPCALWQWTSTGSVPGIAGSVDISEAYSDFAGLIKAAGINGLGERKGADDDRAYAGNAVRSVPPPAVAESPFAEALAWAAGAGILPGGVAPADTPTLAAVAEMFYLLCRREGEARGDGGDLN